MKKKIVIILISLIVLSGIGVTIFFLYLDYVGEEKYLKIKLKGSSEITIDYGEEYKDEGVKATYKKKDISKDVKIKNNLNLEKLGKYKYTYTIKHKKQEKKITRVVNIIDEENPVIELNGKNEISLYVGDKYNEENAKATDNYDKDITDKIEIDGSVDTSKVGEYKLIYSVKDSSDNEASIIRTVKVIEKPKPVQKIAVLNYHFFYKYESEFVNVCDSQSICQSIDKFREQLKYLNDNGFKTLTMKEFVDWMYGKIEIPDKSVLITIDDGAFGTGKANGNYLIPALEEYKIHATLFLVTGWWNIENYRSPYLDVESHTNDLHIGENCGRYGSKVNCIGYDGLLADLKKSIEVTKSKDAFCFPFYEYSSEALRAVKDAGFKVSFVGGNRKVSRDNNKYLIPRYIMYNSTTLEQFKKMVN